MNAFAPLPSLTARFRRDLEALAPAPSSLGVAVSGGPDSLALLLLAVVAFPGKIQAATVDHRLRPESLLEALHVEDICGRIDCPHSILTIDVPRGRAGLQAEARAARYAALASWAERHDVGHILTAHHADDQAETMLMRLRRGSGVAGLAGIRPVRPEGGVSIVRPLLGWSKAELVHLVASAGIEAVDDPANRSPRFDRTAARDLLGRDDFFDPVALARSASALRQADEALAWLTDRLWQERVETANEAAHLDHHGLPPEIKRRLLVRIIAWLGLAPPRGDALGRLIDALERGQPATLSGALCQPGRVWCVGVAPPRRKS